MFCAILEGEMYFEQFYLGCLAHASYLFGSEGEAVVVDPQRDVEIYLEAAAKQGLQIRHIFETHLHADFVSGHKELAARTGATIYIGKAAEATFPHVAVDDGFELQVGHARVNVLETPGHTAESCCFVVTDEEKSPQPWAVLTGDTLFIGDVGRPDLSKTYTPQQLAGMLYDSLHQKLMTLPERRAGVSGARSGFALRPQHARRALVHHRHRAADQLRAADQRPRRIHPADDVEPAGASRLLPGRRGHQSRWSHASGRLAAPRANLTPRELKASSGRRRYRPRRSARRISLPRDTCPARSTSRSSGQFASWAGAVLGLSSRPVLIADNADQISEARMRLARVGIEELAGYLDGGVAAWKQAGFELAQLPQITVEELNTACMTATCRCSMFAGRESGTPDTSRARTGIRWTASRLLCRSLIDRATNAVHCKGGYRSMIACSLLQRAGYNVINVIGGFDAWEEAQMPTRLPPPSVAV